MFRGRLGQLISIHAPREGGDESIGTAKESIAAFQSTPPARGATLIRRTLEPEIGNFNPRPPRGGRHMEGGFYYE